MEVVPTVGGRMFVAFFATVFWGMGVRGLHNLEINVPSAVLVGETVTLECSWQMKDEEDLYSVKWYRGREEFYRYIPKELPHTRVFPLPGIEVDISRSGARRVVLQQATPAMAGRFRCEVSADAPSFHTEIRSAPLEVVERPEWGPKLVSDRSWYGVGSNLRATCASPPAHPPANITFTLNGQEIDAVTDQRETNLSVATRSMRLASAMNNYGLKTGDHVVIISHNHLDLAIPYFACHFNGYPMCAIDPTITLDDLKALFQYIHPKMVFCPKFKVGEVDDSLQKNNHQDCHIVTFEDNNLETFIETHKGTEVNFRPAEFDHSKTIAWLMLTSGTTGLPKVAIIPFDTLLNGLCSWWSEFTERWQITMAMATIQWMSSLIFFASGPLMRFTRVQASVPLTPQLLIGLINKYRPNVTAWTPYLLGQFLAAAGNYCDLSCFKYIAIGGSAIEKPLLDKFREKCGAYLYLVYGMTELLVPVFAFNKDTPFGSTGKEYAKFQYRLVDQDGDASKTSKNGELWIKGDAFFKGYLNNPEETSKILTDDGWFKTGDIFYKDEKGYYYFVERKRLLIKYTGFWISPIQLEQIIRKHPNVAAACVVGIPDKETTETPIAAIVKKKGTEVEPKEIFDLVKESLPDIKQLHGGLFFMDALPETPSGKMHRAKIREIALTAKRITPQ